jgi:hypothetical protein
MMEIREITNSDLAESDIPESRAGLTWQELTPLALSFDAYKYWGSFEKCAEIASQGTSGSLTDLRTKLFMMQRAFRHSYHQGPAIVPRLCLNLVDAIRERVRSGQRD